MSSERPQRACVTDKKSSSTPTGLTHFSRNKGKTVSTSGTKVINSNGSDQSAEKYDITLLMEEIRSALTTKIEESMHSHISHFNEITIKIEANTNSINVLIGNLSTKINELGDRVSLLEDNSKTKCTELETQVMNRLAIIDDKLEHMERKEKTSDLIINNIPKVNGENLYKMFEDISAAINLSDCPPVLSIFRIPSAKSSAPIIAKFPNAIWRQTFFSAYIRSKNLNLTHLGFKTPTRVYINESLTKRNLVIFSKALLLKKKGLINYVSTHNGLVYVKIVGDSNKTFISDVDTLFEIESENENIDHVFEDASRDQAVNNNLDRTV